MISNISRRKIRKLLRENSSDGSLSKSLSSAPDNLTELSIERVRGAIRKDGKRSDLSVKNLQALFKVYQMEGHKLIDFAGFFSFQDQQVPKYLSTYSNLILTNPANIQEKWYNLLSLTLPENFDADCISFVTIVHNILHMKLLDPIPSLLLLNYLIILKFWQDFGSLSMDKSNLLMDHLKGITKALVKLVKHNKQVLYNGNYLQLIENIGSELYPFLLKLFQIIKKKSNYYYCFICLSEIIDKLTKKNLLRSLNLNTLNQLELSLNKKQKLIFEEIFLKQPDPIVDRNLIFKSVILKPYKEDLFNAFLAFEYRNNVNFTKLLYYFDIICEVCQKIENENPKTFEKTLEFKMLLKTLSEIFEYFCSKLSNLNTEYLQMIDSKHEQIAYMARFLSRKKRQELSNVYIKVNGYFDKEPSIDVINILDLMEVTVKKVVKQESKSVKKASDDFSNKFLASLKIMKKIEPLQKRILEMTGLFDQLLKRSEYILNTKAKLKTGKSVLKIMDLVTKQTEVKNLFQKEIEDFLIKFLKVPSLVHKAFLKKLKQRYELFLQQFAFQGRPEIFKLITQNLEQIFMTDESTKQLQTISGYSTQGHAKAEMKDDDDEVDEDDEENEEDDDEDDDLEDEEEGNFAMRMKMKKETFMEQQVTKKVERRKDSVQSTKIMLKEHFGPLIQTSFAKIDLTQISQYIKNIDSLFHEASNHILSSLINMSNEEMNQLLEMLENIVKNLTLNWFVAFPEIKSLNEVKNMLQDYRRFLKSAAISTKLNYTVLFDDMNCVLAHSILPIKVDSSTESIECTGRILEEKEKVYDVEYYFGLRRLDIEEKIEYLESFLEDINKSKFALLAKLKEEAQKNKTFQVYEYSLKKEGQAHLVVSFLDDDDNCKFVIMPSSMNTLNL